jgi:surfactin synthase thioesterase subunit
MLNVYCIPGMGVDERLFKNIQLNNCQIQHVKWQTPHYNETLPEYALRLATQIDTSQPYALMGVSFGGMCAIEIAKQLNPVKTVVISSCKQSAELPFKITFWKKFRLYRHLPDSVFIQGAMIVRKQFGVDSQEQKQRFKEMMLACPKNYFRRAIHCVTHWNNKIIPSNVIHIHGTADKVLPIRKIKCDYIIENGSHLMVVNKADEINQILNHELASYIM